MLRRLVHRRPNVLPPCFPLLASRSSHNVFGHLPPPEFSLSDFTPGELDNRIKNASLLRLVESYRVSNLAHRSSTPRRAAATHTSHPQKHGHRAAKLDPLDLADRPNVPALDPRRYGFNIDPKTFRDEFVSEAQPRLGDLISANTTVSLEGIMDWPGGANGGEKTVEEIAKRLGEVYSSGIGYEFMHLPAKGERRFLERLLEQSHASPIPADQQLAQWRLLARSEGFDAWAAKRFPHVKRYGLEGGEGMMVALGVILQLASDKGVKDVVLAMPHRGRLNVLTQLLDLDMRLLMRGLPTLPPSLPPSQFTDDVLSHLFLTTKLPKAPLRVHLLPNPSHLEAVNPVAMGFARALQIPCGEVSSSREETSVMGKAVLSLQVHGDAAFGGQGVVAESLNLANLPHFTVGGSVRIVVNNQLGYTTDARAGRTSFYATDLAKSIAAPILHVNGDRTDDVARAVTLAFAYQQKFKKDVVVDLVVYRRRGHNELDAPEYTSPVMYKVIEQLPTVPQLYEKSLIASGLLDPDLAASAKKEHFALLDQSLVAATPENFTVPEIQYERGWEALRWPVEGEWKNQIDTGVNTSVLLDVGKRSVEVPDNITIHPRLKRMHIAKRLQSLETGEGIDFSTAEAMAFGSLMLEGYHVRLCGQDSGRVLFTRLRIFTPSHSEPFTQGTFSQRHAVISDQTSTRTTVPLQNLQTHPPASSASKVTPGTIEIVNSPLSEYAVVGFEQGVAWASASLLPIWEAQVILDTFFGGCETKWGLRSALTLLLPHGFDSAGPEHSSARIERFLQLTNEPMRKSEAFVPNIHLINVTTAVQYFHLLRRQMVRDYRKPLVIFSPKGILRLPAAASNLQEFGPGTSFHPVLVDDVPSPSSVKRIVILSGKMYFNLVKVRTERGLESEIAFIRIEELSPFPYTALCDALKSYPNANSFVWAQEEPENAGSYTYVAPRIGQVLPPGTELGYAGRKAMATPAPGVGSYFAEQSKKILSQIFEGI
ncbi:hypothetical protein P7C70_g5306, partial [Phenoliferia sp. Uapishka_3]